MVSACSLRDLKGENQVLFRIPEPIVGGMLMETKNVNEFPELSLMEGGPGDALMKRLRLIRPEFGAASARTAISLAALTWLPLLVFSSIEGLALGGARIPFLYDLAAHARFLVAVPILVLAEIPIGRRLRKVAKRFLDAGLVRDEEGTRFAGCVVDTVWFRDWRPAELTVCAFAYITTYAAISNTSLQSGSTWFEPSSIDGLSPVGYYYALVSLPIFQFLMYRWVFRMVVWTRFLWQVSKLDLFLTPTHPDGAGGLGFVGKGSIPFGVIMFALSSVVSAASQWLDVEAVAGVVMRTEFKSGRAWWKRKPPATVPSSHAIGPCPVTNCSCRERRAQHASTSFCGRSSAAATAAAENSAPATLAPSSTACSSGFSRSRLRSIIWRMLRGASR